MEITQDQVDLLNPTPRDVQLGAIIDQCSGKKATKKMARRRIDFVSGNVNSYARMLNGPKQLEKITTSNQLSASIATLQRERKKEHEKQRELKNKKKKETEVRAAEKKALDKEKRDQLLPICMEHVKQGLQHVLDQNMDTKKAILKYVFKHWDAKLSLRMARENRPLRELMGPDDRKIIVDPDVVDVVNEIVNRVVEEAGEKVNEEMPPLPPLPPLGGDNGPEEDKEADEENGVAEALGALRRGMTRQQQNEKNATGFEPV